jgi:hypothetical protein
MVFVLNGLRFQRLSMLLSYFTTLSLNKIPVFTGMTERDNRKDNLLIIIHPRVKHEGDGLDNLVLHHEIPAFAGKTGKIK